MTPERVAELDTLMQTWNFADRREAIDVAIRFLAKQSKTLATLDLT